MGNGVSTSCTMKRRVLVFISCTMKRRVLVMYSLNSVSTSLAAGIIRESEVK